MAVRYLVWGGYVASQYDGQRHYVSALALVSLYGVPEKECVLLDAGVADALNVVRQVGLGSTLLLRPRHDGNYTLPDPNDRRSYFGGEL